MLALITGVIALTGCGNLAGPDDTDSAANTAKAKQALEAATQDGVTLSLRLASN
jgi:hypothetical protein